MLTGLMYCADCGAKMYVHRTSNGKRVAQYTCSAYTKVPCGTLCKTQHRINESVVLELIRDFNEEAKESMKDKIKKLIANEVKASQHIA